MAAVSTFALVYYTAALLEVSFLNCSAQCWMLLPPLATVACLT
jgi:hypothetical protein